MIPRARGIRIDSSAGGPLRRRPHTTGASRGPLVGTEADALDAAYDELRRLAAAKMADERADHTLSATALVHEAWLRLRTEDAFASKSHYFRAAAEAMRRILVDHARKRNADKRGGDRTRVPLSDQGWTESPNNLVALNDVLDRL